MSKCHFPIYTTTHNLLGAQSAQCQLSVNKRRLISNRLSIPSNKIQLFKFLFKTNGYLAVCRIRAHPNKLSEAEKLLDMPQYFFPFTTSIFKHRFVQASIFTVSWNRWKSSRIWACGHESHDKFFSSFLTWSDKIFVVSAYWMEKEGQTSSGFALACLLIVIF